MKQNVFGRIVPLLLAAAMLFAAVFPAAAAVGYPPGVTEKDAARAVGNTDRFAKSALPALAGDSLSGLVYNALFSDETLSGILTSLYSGMDEQAGSLKNLGIDVSPGALARALGAYPSVASALGSAPSWAEADLAGAEWGVSTKSGFADAAAAVFAPFNDLLYMLLCSGEYKLSILTVDGSDGYANTVMPLLETLDCGEIRSNSSFKSRAESDRNNMVADIVYSLLSFVDKVCASPADELTDVLPELGAYINDGRFEASVNALLEPVTLKIGFIRTFFTGAGLMKALMFFQDPSSVTRGFTENISGTVNGMTAEGGLKLAPIDTARLAECRGKKGDAYTDIVRWLAATIKLNADNASLKSSLPDESLAGMLSSVKDADEEKMTAAIIKLFSQTEGTAREYDRPLPSFTAGSVTYTANLTRDNFVKAYEGIDEVLSEAVADGGEYKDIKEAARTAIYSDKTMTAVANGIASVFRSDAPEKDMSGLVSLVLPGLTPEGFADLLDDRGYSAAASAYRSGRTDSEELKWGIEPGSRKQFSKALTAVLTPLIPLFDAFFANGTLEVGEGMAIGGTNGYETAVIPILEALGCDSDVLVPYEKYVKGAGKSDMITDITDPVLDLADRICERPVYTVCALLPNIVFFIQSGGLMQSVQDLLSPVETLLADLGITIPDFDIEKLKQTDILKEIGAQAAKLAEGMTLPEPDLAKIASLGKAETVPSAALSKGVNAQRLYVRADGPAVFITVLRFIVDALRDPANGEFLASQLSGGGGGMTSQFSSGISDKFAEMTTDETIEWLYRLFFRERAVEEITEEYIPTVIYNRTYRKGSSAGAAVTAAVIAVAAAGVVIWKRSGKKLSEVVKVRRRAKHADT